MKTVHGADFYANKKHKGGAGPKDNSEDSGAGGSSPLPGDEMPMSAKTESVSSPSIKSEVGIAFAVCMGVCVCSVRSTSFNG